MGTASSNSPFEVVVVVHSVSSQGVTVLIQSTSSTQVHSIFVSYVAYNPNILNLVAGSYTYDKYLPVTYSQFTTSRDISNPNLAFHGFNSFIIRNNFVGFNLRADIAGSNQLSFYSSSTFFYLGYSYFILVGGPCGQCQGYSINYNNNCVASCPPNSYFDGVTCITCNPGYSWNGSKCINRCTSEQIWDNTAGKCICPNGRNWNGTNCVACHSSQIWNSFNNTCICPAAANWNGFICITCTSGQIWDANKFSCVCPFGTHWNKFACITCPSGQTWNNQLNNCACPTGTHWNGQTCITCFNGLVWNSQIGACGCNPGYVIFNGVCTKIPTCVSGQTLDVTTNTCVCAAGAYWNGFSCITCTNGQIWNGFSC